MARQVRIEYPGAYYHVMARGDRREAIFEDDRDREMFLETLGEACERARWKVFAWVLMNNHYHWVLQTPEGNLVAGMKWFQNTYTRRLNTRHRLWGHVFGGRYKAIVVESEEEGGERWSSDYLATVMDYVHLNPARAGLAGKERKLLDYEWSSLRKGYAMGVKGRAPWLAVEEGLEVFGWPDTTAARRSFVERLEERALEERRKAGLPAEEELETLQSTLRRGWYWGSQAFQEKMLKLVNGPKAKGNRNYQASRLGQEADGLIAEELLAKGLRHFGLKAKGGGVSIGRKTQTARVAVAWALHRKTNRPQAWIAEKLGLRSPANVSQQVRRFQKELDLPAARTKRRRDEKLRAWLEFVKIC